MSNKQVLSKKQILYLGFCERTKHEEKKFGQDGIFSQIRVNEVTRVHGITHDVAICQTAVELVRKHYVAQL